MLYSGTETDPLYLISGSPAHTQNTVLSIEIYYVIILYMHLNGAKGPSIITS